MVRILFVCTANIDRSPTGEDVFKDQAGFEVKSAGTEDWVMVPISKELIDWADIIFCMEQRHRKKVLEMNLRVGVKTIVLEIPDIYLRGDSELIKLIKAKVSKYIQTNFMRCA